MENGLRQGCCMALVLFNQYTCLFKDCWQARVKDVEEEGRGIVVNLRYIYDHQLFRQYFRNAVERKLTECFLLMIVLSLQQQDQVPRELLENSR